jgi:hypothetical protein
MTTPEDRYLHSLDGALPPRALDALQHEMKTNAALQQAAGQYQRIRSGLARTKPATFGPFFAEAVIQRIQNLKDALDRQIFLFFRRYQMAAWGILVALLIVNLYLSDQLSVPAVLGIEKPAGDDLLTLDIFQELTN